MKPRLCTGVALCLFGLAWSNACTQRAGAQEATAPVAGSPPDEKLTCLVEVNGDDPDFNAERIAKPLSQELNAHVKPVLADDGTDAAGVITISWRPSRGELAVAFHSVGSCDNSWSRGARTAKHACCQPSFPTRHHLALRTPTTWHHCCRPRKWRLPSKPPLGPANRHGRAAPWRGW